MTATSGPDSLAADLGTSSPPIIRAIRRLEALYGESESLSPVEGCFRAWAARQPSGTGGGVDAFIRHTCLSLICRLMAYRFLTPRGSERDLWDVLSGDYFAGEGLGNFLGEDFFSWPFFRLSMGVGDDAAAMDMARSLMAALELFDFDQPPPELLPTLYRDYQGAADFTLTPTLSLEGEGEVREIVEGQAAAIAELQDLPMLSCIAPDCGDGDALARAVSAAAEGRLAWGQDLMEALLDLSSQFLGMTPDPLAATVASTAFLFALGETAKGPHPPILIPVYLADAARVPQERGAGNGERSFVIEVAGGIVMPEQVAADPLYLDWLLGRLPNYQRGAALRLRAQPEAEAVQEVLNAWYNYLTSPKTRTPIPEPLTPAAADVMVEAARTLIVAYMHGSGPAPLHLARNAPAPLFAARREFDLTI